MKARPYIRASALGIPLLIVAVAWLIKVIIVEQSIVMRTGANFFGLKQVALNDAAIHCSIVTFFYLSYIKRIPYLIRVLLRCSALVLILIYIVDVYILHNFSTHLVVSDIFRYGNYALEYVQQAHGGDILIVMVFGAIFSGILGFLIFNRFEIEKRSIHRMFAVLIAGLVFTTIAGLLQRDSYIHSWLYRDVISHNLIVLSENKEYSGHFDSGFSFTEAPQCLATAPEQPNRIILLMVESLSSYHSSYFSGIRDWTPNLDQIARQHSAYPNFFANGFTTEDAEIAMLTGLLPIHPPSSFTYGGGVAFKGFFNIQESLPNILKRHNYTTEFLTTADLQFANTGAWANSIGFDHVEGHDQPFYDNWQRFLFYAAPDEALYQRIIQRMQGENEESPYFYFIKTVSTHHPFINPETGERSEEETIRYADKALGAFYDRLESTGFFEQGMLLIVGDHRAMVPLKAGEVDKFGPERASAMVPLVIAYSGAAAPEDGEQYQQIGIFNSLAGLVSGDRCHSAWAGDLFSGEQAEYITHRRGDTRNLISVFAKDRNVRVVLDGDNTRVVTEYPENQNVREDIVGKINSVRLRKFD